MKVRNILHSFNQLTSTTALIMLLATSAFGANRWWDGPNNAGAGDGVGQGGGDGWGSVNTNWDQGLGLDHTNWVNGADDTAIFEGTSGTVTITHGNGVQVTALIFQTNGYTLNSISSNPERGVLCGSSTLATSILVASNAIATINANITNGPSSNRKLQVGGRGTLVLNGTNMFHGQMIIGNNTPAAIFVNGTVNGQAPTVQARIIANLGVASSLGEQFTEANGTIQIGDASTSGILEYTGTNAASTDRKVQVGSSASGGGGATIRNNNANPSYTLTFSNPAFNAPATSVASFNRTLTLSGSNTGNNTISGQITNNVGTTGGTNSVTKSGSGVWVLGGSNLYSGVTTVSGGVLKLDHANAIPGGIGAAGGTSGLTLAGGVVGLTANSGNFTRTNGTGADQVQWTASGGFAAYGGTRTVKLSASSQNWGNGGLLGNGYTLILGSADADGTLDWQQALSFAGAARTVQVDDGSAAVDAIMSANIVGGTSGSANGFIKTGSGTLALTGANSYWGPTTISNGTLQVGNGSSGGRLSSNSTNTIVATNATLAVKRSDAVTQASGGVLGNGTAVISGEGGFSQVGSGTTTLTLTNTYTGDTTVSAGTLVIQVASIATNSTVRVAAGAVLNLGFTETNIVAAFYTNGVALPNGVYKAPNVGSFLAGTGSLQVGSVVPVTPSPAVLTNSLSGSTLTLTWPSGEGWTLKSQTNTLSTGLNTNASAWGAVPGAGDGSISITIDPANPTVFYRLEY